MTRKPVVEAGQVYRIPRNGKPAHHVKVVTVDGRRGDQPKIRYVLVTRTGNKKSLGLGKNGPKSLVTWAQFRDGAWSVPSGWELVEEGEWS